MTTSSNLSSPSEGLKMPDTRPVQVNQPQENEQEVAQMVALLTEAWASELVG